MFCPNCGAQNQDTATACAKCGFTLKAAAAAPKFKGTMLMMNAPPAAVPRPGAAAPGGAPPAAAPPAGAPPAAAPPAAQPAAPAAAAPAAARPKLKGTMIGVAPPSMGSQVGPANAQPPAPVPAAAPPQYTPPPPAAPAYEPPPPAAPAPRPTPHSAVNPLGGTVVADTNAFVAGAPPPQGGYPHAEAPPPQNFAGGQTAGFAAPPPEYGAPPQPQGYGAPPQPQGYGAPPPGFGAPPAPGFGGQPQGYGAPPPNFGAPPDVLGATAPAVEGGGMYQSNSSIAPVRDSLAPIPGLVGGTNPIVTVLLIVLTCGVYGIYLLVKGKKSASS